MKIPEQKVILCGEYGAGKSSLFRRFTNNTFVTSTDRQSTLGLDHFEKIYQVDDRDLKVCFCYFFTFHFTAIILLFHFANPGHF